MKTLEKLYAIIHLHTVSGSIGDSILKIKDLVKKAKKLNIPAIAMTNHGSMADMYDFYFECVSNNIKPIIGCEVYTVEDRELKEKDNKATNHLILLAKDNIGLKNLLTICADAELVGKYYRPRTDLNFLETIDTTGIVATTACVGSEVNQLILDGKLEEAETLLLRLNNIFEDFYLEVQPGEFEDQITVNKQLVEFSEKLNIPLIASNDVHYLDAEDDLIRLANNKKEMKPITYQMKETESLIVENLIRLNSDKNNSITFFGSANLKLQKVYENNVRLKNNHRIVLEVPNNSQVVLKGIGFFYIKHACMLTLYGVREYECEVIPSFMGGNV